MGESKSRDIATTFSSSTVLYKYTIHEIFTDYISGRITIKIFSDWLYKDKDLV